MKPSNDNDSRSPLGVQTSELEPRKIKRSGLTIVKRSSRPDAKYVCRIRFRGKVHEITLAETASKSFDIAVRARRALHEGRWDELKASTALRQGEATKLCDLFAVYRQYRGPNRPADGTRELNIHALTAIIREVLGIAVNVNVLPLNKLDCELVWRWKEIKRGLAANAETDERKLQILRSANSRLRQGRSLFSENEDLRTFYRFNKLVLPREITGFCKEPSFSDCSKTDYHPPPDHIIVRTFESLSKLGDSSLVDDINMFKACWLAIGFGLRKSEIAAAKPGWFVNVNGTIFCRGDVLAKNGKFPEVRVQLGAWDRLKPFVEGADPNSFLLAGTNTDRNETTFRRISEWMRSLGWETTHHIHEFRAWAGCQIAMAPGNDIREAQVFMRHKHFATTEQFYGHHLKVKLGEVKLGLPTVTPKEFVPVVLPSAGA